MANALSVYDPIFYAQEAIIALEKALGMAGTVHRGYDKDPQSKGSTISISKPSVFTAADAPATAEDLAASNVDISLDQWREVKFKLSDKELTFTTEKIIVDHIRPAAYELARDIDSKLQTLHTDIPWFYDITAAGAVIGDVTSLQQVLFDNDVPEDGSLFCQIDGTTRKQLLDISAFSQHQGAGNVGVERQLRGQIGDAFGFMFYANQNVPTHTSGTVVTAGTDVVGAVNGAAVKGAVAMTIDALDGSETLLIGDTFVITGNTQRHALTANTTLSTGAGSITFTPSLPAAVADNAVITFEADGASVHAGSYAANMGYHRNAFALAMAPLSEMGNQLGANIATVTDPVTNLSLRSRLYYVGNSSEVHVALDVLYGVKTLDPNRAAKFRRNV